jgi:hypothetical protein
MYKGLKVLGLDSMAVWTFGKMMNWRHGDPLLGSLSCKPKYFEIATLEILILSSFKG